ncbi:FAD/NAD(P)-binding domain-containing protein [Tothia fuscella]|uniref:FAD/NAD(P)-binding domain-containing protein n=1 Tax=Tothia fuscella TaxID=1048955 RepID=A0A9P4NZB3_9PEZI|nr:FAD/NAD(P)-binding domain-containing protein [Tothia fuscella]
MGRIFAWIFLLSSWWSVGLALPSQPSSSYGGGGSSWPGGFPWSTGGFPWPTGLPWSGHGGGYPKPPKPTQPHTPPTPVKAPVCIVGAGPAGLTAANRLENKGYETVIFDKQAEVGGKCQAYYENNTFHPLGAAFFSNASYPETVKVIDAAGVSITPFLLADSDRQQYNFNYTTGSTTPVVQASPALRAILMSEIPRYISIWQALFANVSVPGYKNGVPENFTIPGAAWFAQNGFIALPLVLVNPLALYGYGDIRQVPILYIMQYITPDILTAFIGLHNVYLTDFHKIWVEWTKKSIKGTIKTHTNITGIDRSGVQPIIKYSGGKQTCSSVVLAFPPTADNLKAAGLDATSAENDLFKLVGTNNYYSAAVNLKVPYGVSYIESSEAPNVPPPNVGEPVALLVLHNTSSIATTWSWGPYRQYQSESDAYNLLQQTLSKINKDPRNLNSMSVGVTSSDIRAFRKWDYFPHFDTPDLKNDAYGKFNALQGQRKTYYASGLNGMETVEWAIRAGSDIAASYF